MVGVASRTERGQFLRNVFYRSHPWGVTCDDDECTKTCTNTTKNRFLFHQCQIVQSRLRTKRRRQTRLGVGIQPNTQIPKSTYGIWKAPVPLANCYIEHNSSIRTLDLVDSFRNKHCRNDCPTSIRALCDSSIHADPVYNLFCQACKHNLSKELFPTNLYIKYREQRQFFSPRVFL